MAKLAADRRDSSAGGAERGSRLSGLTVGLRPAPAGRTAAWAAFVVGGLYAALSVYWGLGGTWLLDTVGGSLAEHRHSTGVIVAVWVAGALS